MDPNVALESVRKQLLGKVDCFICGSGDAHQSEYVSPRDKRRAFVSNFTGSAGTALILQSEALLWTDGRYFLQAESELSSSWTLMKSGNPGVPELDRWIYDNLPENSVVGVDAYLISASQSKSYQHLWKSKNISILAVDVNPVDVAWDEEGTRPGEPSSPIKIHSNAYSGFSYADKITKIQDVIRTNNSNALVVSMLDEIAWLFNIRGSDISYNPVVISYAVVTLEKSFLFVSSSKVTQELVEHLDASIVEILGYSDIEGFLLQLSRERKRVLVDPVQVNWRIYRALSTSVGEDSAHIAAIDFTSPITLSKSLKNEHELTGVRNSHIRDGVALTAFLHWLEGAVVASPNTLSEWDVAVRLEEFRGSMPLHVGPSFTTISGYGSNGAIIHYSPDQTTAALLGLDNMFLLDSGAQYLDGTTDVTRTLHFGNPSDHMKTCYTLVLKGHIALARAVFPEGTLGSRLDCLARYHLWSAGLDYNHGTGHGVGAYLNVHEGPQGIGFRKRENEIGFFCGMTSSNEPGYYEDGQFGIRIENVCITVEADTPHRFNNKRYCRFEDATLVPIKSNLLNLDLLDDVELQWLNDYHARVRAALTEGMNEHFPEALSYLIAETEPILRII